MKNKTIATALLSLTVVGCATTGPSYYPHSQTYDRNQVLQYQQSQEGVIEDVRTVFLRSDPNRPGSGALLGALIGGALGNQVGNGDGRTAATIGGVVAGAMIGDKMQDNQRGTPADEVTVRLRDGRRITIVLEPSNWYRGQSVWVIDNGQQIRLAPRN